MLKILICFVLIQISSDVSAQFSIGAHIGTVKPQEMIFFWGGEVSGHFNLSDDFRVGLNVGYHKNIPTWMVDKETGVAQKVWSTSKPVTLSGEYFFLRGEAVRPYVGLHAGVLALGNRYANYRTHDYYTYVSPVLGLEYQLTRQLYVSFKLKYGVGLSKYNDPTKLTALTAGLGMVHTIR